MTEPHRFICWEHESDTRGAWYSRPRQGYHAVVKAARAHVIKYHSRLPVVDIDIEVFRKGELQIKECIQFEND